MLWPRTSEPLGSVSYISLKMWQVSHTHQLPEEVQSEESHDSVAAKPGTPLDTETVKMGMIVHTCLPS